MSCAALAALACGLGLLALREPGLSVDAADGTYVHDCCGRVELRRGRMLLGGAKSVDYSLERDENGPYLLPNIYVGTWEDRGFEVDGSRAPMKLRLDTVPRASRIVVPAATGRSSFTRKPPRPSRTNSSI